MAKDFGIKMKSFEEAWAGKEKEGYQYGGHALENVEFGYEICMKIIHSEVIPYYTDRIKELENTIRNHRDEKMHDRCWLDDLKLYSILPEGVPEDVGELPCKEEFLKGCEKYYELRRKHSSEDADKIARKFNGITQEEWQEGIEKFHNLWQENCKK